jgi:hypothetical protein
MIKALSPFASDDINFTFSTAVKKGLIYVIVF